VKYPHLDNWFTHDIRCGTAGAPRGCLLYFSNHGGAMGPPAPGATPGARRCPTANTYVGNIQMGSLTGAVRLLQGNAGVLRRAQVGQKPTVEHKSKSSLDRIFQ